MAQNTQGLSKSGAEMTLCQDAVVCLLVALSDLHWVSVSLAGDPCCMDWLGTVQAHELLQAFHDDMYIQGMLPPSNCSTCMLRIPLATSSSSSPLCSLFSIGVNVLLLSGRSVVI